MAATFKENKVDLPSGSFTVHLASLGADIAYNPRCSWSNLIQYNNTDHFFGCNSRLRFIPEAGRETVLLFNYGAEVDAHNHLSSTANAINLKASYTV
jgi:hypothetical protein